MCVLFDSIGPGLKRMCIGVLYIALHQIGDLLFPEEYMLSDSFMVRQYIS